MKWYFRFLVFAVAFYLGLLITSMFVPIDSRHGSEDFGCLLTVPIEHARLPEGIKVMYAGWERGTGPGDSYLKFVIFNGTPGVVSYSAQDDSWGLPPIISSNDGKGPHRCGNGFADYYLFPAQSAEIRVYEYEFVKRIEPGRKIIVSFDLGTKVETSDGPYSTEPFQLPEEFRRSVNKQLPKCVL